jgi:hypothetical protein
MKKFKFAIVDNTTYTGQDALDFYSKALLEGPSKSTFRVIPGVKSKIKLPRYDAGNIIQEAGCTWTPTGEGTLDQKSFEVCSKDIQLELCTTTFENNFLGELLRPGHNTGEVAPTVFLDYMLGEVGKKVQNDLEIAVWQGDADALNYPQKICNGLLKKFDDDAAVITPTPAGAIDLNNVIAEVTKVYEAIPTTIVTNPNLRIYVSDYIYRLYQQAIAAASNEAYYVGAKTPNYLGIDLIWAPGMPAGNMVAAVTDNVLLFTDLLSDEEELNVIPQAPVSGVRTVRIAGGFKFGVDYLISEEIVWYNGNAAS